MLLQAYLAKKATKYSIICTYIYIYIFRHRQMAAWFVGICNVLVPFACEVCDRRLIILDRLPVCDWPYVLRVL